jgi:hypothetical protein
VKKIIGITTEKANRHVWSEKEHVFPETILTHPAQNSRQAVEKWLNAGGVNQAV